MISIVEVSKREDERRAECDDLGSERKTLALFHCLDLVMNAITRRWILVIRNGFPLMEFLRSESVKLSISHLNGGREC